MLPELEPLPHEAFAAAPEGAEHFDKAVREAVRGGGEWGRTGAPKTHPERTEAYAGAGGREVVGGAGLEPAASSL